MLDNFDFLDTDLYDINHGNCVPNDSTITIEGTSHNKHCFFHETGSPTSTSYVIEDRTDGYFYAYDGNFTNKTKLTGLGVCYWQSRLEVAHETSNSNVIAAFLPIYQSSQQVDIWLKTANSHLWTKQATSSIAATIDGNNFIARSIRSISITSNTSNTRLLVNFNGNVSTLGYKDTLQLYSISNTGVLTLIDRVTLSGVNITSNCTLSADGTTAAICYNGTTLLIKKWGGSQYTCMPRTYNGSYWVDNFTTITGVSLSSDGSVLAAIGVPSSNGSKLFVTDYASVYNGNNQYLNNVTPYNFGTYILKQVKVSDDGHYVYVLGQETDQQGGGLKLWKFAYTKYLASSTNAGINLISEWELSNLPPTLTIGNYDALSHIEFHSNKIFTPINDVVNNIHTFMLINPEMGSVWAHENYTP